MSDMQLVYSDWMASFSGTFIADLPLSQLYIPGSHDSGAYDLNIDRGFAVDIKNSPLWLLNTFWFVTSKVFLAYSLTQKYSIFEQLNRGVRYLDLRVGFRPEDGELYAVHSFYGPTLKSILDQVDDFLRQHTKEVVILDFQHVHNLRAKDHARLINLLVEIFSSRLAPAELLSHSSLNSFWDKGYQVAVFYRNSRQATRLCHNLLLTSDRLSSPWGDIRNAGKLRSFLLEKLANRPHDSQNTVLFVTQAVLTPDAGYVATHPFGSLESNLAKNANALLATDLVPEEEKYLNRKSLANVIMFDFVGWGQYGSPLPGAIIRLNHKQHMLGRDYSKNGQNFSTAT